MMNSNPSLKLKAIWTTTTERPYRKIAALPRVQDYPESVRTLLRDMVRLDPARRPSLETCLGAIRNATIEVQEVEEMQLLTRPGQSGSSNKCSIKYELATGPRVQ